MENLEELIIKRPPPLNLSASKKHLYDMSGSGLARSFEVKMLNDVYVNRELLIFRGGKILEESFAEPWHLQKWYVDNKVNYGKFLIKNNLMRIRQTRIKDALWSLNSYSTGGYFHWITEVLTRIWMVKKHLNEYVLLIPDYFYYRWPFIKESFEAFNIKNFHLIQNNEKIFVENLCCPSMTGGPLNYQPKPLKEVSNFLIQFYFDEESPKAYKRIFISRKKANYRRILNEEELIPILRKHGFEIICLEDYDFKTQINIVNRAEVMVGIHGAGLTNMVFLPENSKVLELRIDHPNHVLNCFYNLAYAFNHKYFFLTTGNFKKALNTEKRIDDYSMVFDPVKFEDELMKVLQF